jgi:DNA-binding GntR family transcriptional regulator
VKVNNLIISKGSVAMKDRIPDQVFREIFPRRLKKHQVIPIAYNQLKKMILSGKLKKGERLVQEKLAHDLNVSRMPIIRAIRQLKKDGLVVWKSKKGAFVA